ncbi:hypothetical protein [Bradyrhizobium sp. MOS003]|uniref:hypothetical protein n=1 Tax=Bradyrhizobium sp. MOS003 TaxID=2133946 RepID=UPI001FE20FE2|nr:hypothetical protein [Bradyrhizobium sp. MOS003]
MRPPALAVLPGQFAAHGDAQRSPQSLKFRAGDLDGDTEAEQANAVAQHRYWRIGQAEIAPSLSVCAGERR